MATCLCYAHELTKIHQIIRGKLGKHENQVFHTDWKMSFSYWRTCFCMKETQIFKTPSIILVHTHFFPICTFDSKCPSTQKLAGNLFGNVLYHITQPDLTLFHLIFTYLWGKSLWRFRNYGSNVELYHSS